MSLKDLEFWHIQFPDDPLIQEMLDKGKQLFSPIRDLQKRNPRKLISKLQKLQTYKDMADAFIEFLELLDWGFFGFDFEKGFIVVGSMPRYLEKFNKAKRQAYQSATFYNIDITRKLFGLPRDTSIVGPDFLTRPMGTQLGLFLTTTTSLKQSRNKYTYTRMATAIERLSQQSPRHILILFPSYDYINEILPYFSKQFLNKCLIEKEDTHPGKLIKPLFKDYRPLAILANQRGKIMEGIEWVKDGNSLISLVIMAGMATFVPSEEEYVEPVIKTSFRERFISKKEINEMIYQYPLYLIAKQAYGRAIRGQGDRAAFILLDSRADKFLARKLHLKWGLSLEKMEIRLTKFFDNYPTLRSFIDPLDMYF